MRVIVRVWSLDSYFYLISAFSGNEQKSDALLFHNNTDNKPRLSIQVYVQQYKYSYNEDC